MGKWPPWLFGNGGRDLSRPYQKSEFWGVSTAARLDQEVVDLARDEAGLR
jgi:hypothetical protein